MLNPKKCPICGSNSKTIDSRLSENRIRRRKQCNKCGVRFTTYEITEIEIDKIKKMEKAIHLYNRR